MTIMNDIFENPNIQLIYDLSDEEQIRECFDKYGIVAIRDVLSKNEIEDSIKDIENIIRATNKPDFSFDNPDTYEDVRNSVNAHGVIGKTPLFTKQLLHNRLHPNVVKAYKILYGEEVGPLLCQHDRVAWMRPTIGPNYEDWAKFRTPFIKPGIHLDVDPVGYYEPNYETEVLKFLNSLDYSDLRDFLHENNSKHISMGLQLQGVLNLIDNDDEDGGFHCVLGGHKHLEEWFNNAKKFLDSPKPNGRYNFTENKTDRVFGSDYPTTRIPCPAGTLIIFDATLPHGTKPNMSQNNRMIQFSRYMPKSAFNPNTLKKRANAINKICKDVSFVPSNIEKEYLF